MQTAGATLIAAVLLFSSGCVTRPDWIESTLVTVDVTGVWQGTVSGGTRAGGGGPNITLYLEQEGPKVKGRMELDLVGAAQGRGSGALAGSVGGDVFHFTVVSRFGEGSGGELRVSGDEMVGEATLPAFEGSQRVRLSLRRADAPASPRR